MHFQGIDKWPWFDEAQARHSKSDAMSESTKSINLHPSGSHGSTALRAGTPAPDFGLRSTPDQTVRLSEFLGQPVVLAFYPADWSPVCGDQMALYNEMLAEFQDLGAEILGISVDGSWCHAAFSRDRKLHFPLLADFEPKGAVARMYGVYRQDDGVCERALFVINAEGVIHWSYVSPVGVNPGAAGILAALEELQNKQEAK
jgi:peroxiredoxin